MENEHITRAALSRLMEPQDAAGLALVQAAGAWDALRIATGQIPAGPALEQEITGLLADSGAATGWGGMARSRPPTGRARSADPRGNRWATASGTSTTSPASSPT